MTRAGTMLAALLLLTAAGIAWAGEALPPAVQAIKSKGVEIVKRFDAPDGLTGYLARYKGQAMTLYVTSSGEHVIAGTLFDKGGANLSQTTIERQMPHPELKDAWAKLEKAAWVAEGPVDPKRVVYAFIDTNCPYCHHFWERSQPLMKRGVQVRTILVATLKQSSYTEAAAILTAKDPAALFAEHERRFSQGGIEGLKKVPKAIGAKIQANTHLLNELGGRGTPMILYRDKDGRVQRVAGLPDEHTMRDKIFAVDKH